MKTQISTTPMTLPCLFWEFIWLDSTVLHTHARWQNEGLCFDTTMTGVRKFHLPDEFCLLTVNNSLALRNFIWAPFVMEHRSSIMLQLFLIKMGSEGEGLLQQKTGNFKEGFSLMTKNLPQSVSRAASKITSWRLPCRRWRWIPVHLTSVPLDESGRLAVTPGWLIVAPEQAIPPLVPGTIYTFTAKSLFYFI